MAALKHSMTSMMAFRGVAIGHCRVKVRSILLRTFSDSSTVDKCSEEFFKHAVKRPLVVFMKGVPASPMCGFSRLVVQILNMHGVSQFDFYDVLEDQDFKEAVKQHSNWPTFPQVYVNGEFIGGADVLLQMHQSGDLAEELKKVGHTSTLLQVAPAETK